MFCAIAAMSILGSAFGAEKTVKILETYDQLINFTGKDGVYVVKDAATMHGDPTVRYGWAVYVWDGTTRGFRLISKKEAIDNANLDMTRYITKSLYLQDVSKVKATVETNATIVADCDGRVTALSGVTDELTASLAATISLLDSTTGRVDVAEADIVALKEKGNQHDLAISTINDNVAGLDTRLTAAEQNITALDGKIDVKEVEIKSYADSKIAENKLDIITNTAVRVRAVRDQARANLDTAVIDVTTAFQAGDTNALAQAKTYAEEKAAAAEAAANSHADGQVEALRADAAATYQVKGPYLVPADIAGKVDRSDIFNADGVFETVSTKNNGTIARIWNEADGGGAQIVDGTSGIQAFTGVNEGSGWRDIYAQVYAVDKTTKVGTRLSVTPTKIYYTAGKGNADVTDGDEVATVGKFADYQPAGNYISVGDALDLPLRVKKGNTVYVIDVVDNGGDDLTLSVNRE